MKRGRRPAEELRRAIDCLPRATRAAMLEGVRAEAIVVGAYTDGEGGICPMLAAHRRGGRTSLASFARAWDRYTGAGRRARRATERERRVLTAMLEASLGTEAGGEGQLAAAVAEHRAARRARLEREAAEASIARAAAEAARAGARSGAGSGSGRAAPDTGERDRSSELRPRAGWAWLRVFRRHDEFVAALARVGEAERAAQAERAPGADRAPERESAAAPV